MTTEKTKAERISETVARLKPFFDKEIVKLDAGAGLHQLQPTEDGIEYIHQDGCQADGIEICCLWNDIPLPDKSVNEIHYSDAVEHIPVWEYDAVLGELNRILKVGGKIWGNTPNVHSVTSRYGKGEISFQDMYLNLYGWADSKWQQHYQTFMPDTLTPLMEKYGFGKPDYTKSPGIQDGDPNTAWWIVFEFTKLRDLK